MGWEYDTKSSKSKIPGDTKHVFTFLKKLDQSELDILSSHGAKKFNGFSNLHDWVLHIIQQYKLARTEPCTFYEQLYHAVVASYDALSQILDLRECHARQRLVQPHVKRDAGQSRISAHIKVLKYHILHIRLERMVRDLSNIAWIHDF